MNISARKETIGNRIEDTFKQWKQYVYVIKELTAREIKRKYARSYLGILWSVLNPLMTMAVLSLIFSTMFKRSIENYPIYLLTGQIIWGCYTGATNASMSALVDNKSLLIKSQIPKRVYVMSRVYTALVNFGYTLIAYVFMIAVFHIGFSIVNLLLFVDVFFILIFSLGIGYLLSIAYVFFADVKHLYSVVLTMLMYMSAIFYPVANLSESIQKVVNNNPIYVFIYFARTCVMYGEVPEKTVWIKMITWSVASITIGSLIFKKKENDVMAKI